MVAAITFVRGGGSGEPKFYKERTYVIRSESCVGVDPHTARSTAVRGGDGDHSREAVT